MALRDRIYDHPNYLINFLVSLGATAATASGTNCEFCSPIDFKLRNVKARAKVAGTSATNTLTVRKNTTSIGLLTLADSAAGFIATSGDLNTSFNATDVLNLLKGTDATGTATVVAELQFPVGTQFNV